MYNGREQNEKTNTQTFILFEQIRVPLWFYLQSCNVVADIRGEPTIIISSCSVTETEHFWIFTSSLRVHGINSIDNYNDTIRKKNNHFLSLMIIICSLLIIFFFPSFKHYADNDRG